MPARESAAALPDHRIRGVPVDKGGPILWTMTPEPSDPSVVSVEVPLYAVNLPPIGGIVLTVLVIVAVVLVVRRVRMRP